MKEIVFGAGEMGKRYCSECGGDTTILAFADNDPAKWGKQFLGHRIINPESIQEEDYDRIVIAIYDLTADGCKTVLDILNQLSGLNVPLSKIALPECVYSQDDPRVDFVRRFAAIITENRIEGAAAECGVYRGHFTAYINKYLPLRQLYLFDTFEGFDDRDLELERNLEAIIRRKSDPIAWFSYGSADIALLRCPHRERVIVKKGCVPETFSGLEGERFAFVSLDMDLYAPTLDALRFFAPRLTPGGVILLHDYYHSTFSGIKQAVDEFAKEFNFTRLPMGDHCSIAIVPTSALLQQSYRTGTSGGKEI